MKIKNRLSCNNGFTLIELLLVVGIIGVLLAVVIPRAIRSNVNAKYGIVDKNCAELKSYAVQWAEKSIRAQDEQNSTATLGDYYASLTGQAAGLTGGFLQQWIATSANNNWNMGNPPVPGGATIMIAGRQMQGAAAAPEDTVEDIIPPEKSIRNPFNSVSVFRNPNDPATQGNPVTGAIALGFQQENVASGAFYYFAFAYQGTDSTTMGIQGTDGTSFHAGSGLSDIPALRNGQLFARIR